jgi:ribosome maturation factor RimP
MGVRPSREHLRSLLEPVVTAAELDLEDVEVTPAGRRRLLRVVVDGETGVGLNAVADVSRSISAVLDASDVMGAQPYVLEVSSPGVDRPLTEPRHWRRARTRLVHAALVDGSAVTGRVVAADERSATLDVGGEQRRVLFGDVTRARVQVDFSRPPDDSYELDNDTDGDPVDRLDDGPDEPDEPDEMDEEA